MKNIDSKNEMEVRNQYAHALKAHIKLSEEHKTLLARLDTLKQAREDLKEDCRLNLPLDMNLNDNRIMAAFQLNFAIDSAEDELYVVEMELELSKNIIKDRQKIYEGYEFPGRSEGERPLYR